MPDFRAIVAFDISATDKEHAKKFAVEIYKRHIGEKQRVTSASAREGAYEGSKASVWGADLIEVRDR